MTAEAPHDRAAGERGVPRSGRALDLICMGRLAVDFYAEQIGSPLAAAQTFRMYLGGSPANVAVGSARLGLRVAMLSRVGADELGRFLRDTLEREGVRTDLLVDDPDHLTALVVLGVAPPDRFPLIFFRERCADMETRLEDVGAERLAESSALLVTGTGLSRPDTARATHDAVAAARAAGTAVVFDLDYRPVLWGLAKKGDGETRYRLDERVTAAYADVLPDADLVVGTEEELRVAAGCDDVVEALERLRSATAATLVRKRGAAGCSVHVAGREALDVAGSPVEVLNVLGAGDGFLAGFLRGWLRGEDLATCARWANGAGALVVSRHGCAPAMPFFPELQWFLAQPDPRAAATGPALARMHRRAIAGRPRDLLVLAFDHHDQLEESCDRRSAARQKIAAFKELVFRGFERARATAGVADAAVLVDPVHGAAVLAAATEAGLPLGAPIERAGSLPVEWLGEGPLYAQVLERPPAWWVKVLVHLHAGMERGILAAQLARLGELQEVCDRLERRLMVEVVAPPGLAFAETDLAAAAAACYGAGVDPAWWKVPPQSEAGWRALTATIDGHGSGARVVVLGGGEPLPVLAAALRVARSTPHGAGFAVGRSVFWEAWTRHLDGSASDEEVVSEVAERYLALVQAWETAAMPAAAGVAR